MLRSGYEPSTDEDKQKIERLFKVDPDLIIVSAPGDQNAEFKRQWYVFDKNSNVDPTDPEVWDSKNREKQKYYIKSSFRVALKKVL